MKLIVSKLRKLNIEIGLVAGKLRVNAPEGVLTPELLEEIKANKEYLIEYINTVSGKRNIASIQKVEKKEFYQLSSAQKRLYILNEMDKNSLAYNETQTVSVEGQVDRDRLVNTFNRLVMRHESLRTYFELIGDEPVQKIADRVDLAIEQFKGEGEAIPAIISEFIKPFDLSKAPLFRIALIETPSNKHIVVVDTHHIITDAMSEGVLINDFRALYANRESHGLPLQYKDYAEWQQGKKRQQEIAEHKEFWVREFSRDIVPLNLPTDFARPLMKGRNGDVLQARIGYRETVLLKDIAATEGVSMFMLLLSLYNILLSKLSNQEDIVIGIPMSDRQYPELEQIMGLFISTLALRNYPKSTLRFREFLADLKSRVLASFDNQSYPYEALIDELKIPRSTSRNPLFDVWFIYQNYEKALVEQDGVSLFEWKRENKESKFDIILETSESDREIALTLTYSADLFKRETVERFITYFKRIVTAVAADSNIMLSDIILLSEEEIGHLSGPVKDYVPRLMGGQAIVPASYHQERLWFIDRFESNYLYEGNPVYHNIPLIVELNGRMDPVLLEKSMQAVIANYDILRTRIVTIDERPFQSVMDHYGFGLTLENADTTEVDQRIHQEINRPFESDGKLIRATLFSTEANKFILLVILHHAIADRHSVIRFLKEVLLAYRSYSLGQEPEKNYPSLQYTGFSLWQQECLSKIEFYLLSYWKRQLGGKLKALELPTDRPRAAIHIYKSASVDIRIPDLSVMEIKHYAERSMTDERIFLMGCFIVLLYKYCRHDEIVIGTSAHNRTEPVLEQVMGPVANLIVLRNFLSQDMSFSNFLSTLKDVYTLALKHQAMPFDKLVKELAPEKDMSRTALFDVLFQYEAHKAAFPGIEEVDINIRETNLGYGKYDLNLFLQKNDNQIQGKLVYNAEYFDRSTIESMVAHYCELVQNIIVNPTGRLSGFSMISKEEKQRLLSCLNETGISYPADKTIIDLFTAQVSKTPAAIAVRLNQETISYGELDQRSTRLALLLQGKGVQSNHVVGLLAERSIDTVVGMLAILKAGGAYLPIDIDYPQDRINFLVTDSGIRVLLTTTVFQGSLPENIETLFIEDSRQPGNLEVSMEYCCKPSDICYVIYTSGTTGKPKGVMVEHRNVVRLFFNEAFQFDFGQNDVWTMFHSHCFDFSVWEIYGALFFGGRVIIIPKMIARDTRAFLEILKNEQVTVLNQTPSAFYNLVQEEMSQKERALQLRYIIFGGEALSPGRLKSWRAAYPGVTLVNMFGITETTVHVTYKEIGNHEIENNISNVGKPIPTLSVYLFDENQQLVPQGVIGELYVGGAGVSRGYLGNEELTRKKFVPNPYDPTERLYRTGDLGRILQSGEIEYIGRIDHQVQLRGFRIELGEIESQLNAFDGVRESVVLARGKEGDKYLVAYYISSYKPDIAELRSYLLAKLPDYMVPAYYVQLEKMPLTSNGKLDRDALPDPEIKADEKYLAPASETEQKLVDIWSEILKIDKNLISVNRSFFELGGHSLRAAILVNTITKELGTALPLKEVFRNQDIRSLSKLIQGTGNSLYASITRAALKDQYAQSSPQQRLYFLYELDKTSIAYNLPQIVKITGDLDLDVLTGAFHKLIRRHESLRTSFEVVNGMPIQQIHDTVPFEIQYFRSGREKAADVIDRFIQPFDLSKPPLIRAGLIEVAHNEYILMVDMHHIISDGVSQSIMIRDVSAFYRQEELYELPIQYKDYAEWEQSAKQKEDRIARQQAFWLNEFAEETTSLELPADYPRPSIRSYEGSMLSFELSEKETAALSLIVQSEGASLFMGILSIYTIFLSKLSNKEDIVIGTPVAGRRHADIENIIGMFVNTLPLRSCPSGELSFGEYLAVVKERTLACFDNQDYPYETLIDDLKIVRDTSRNPLFDTLLMFQNFEKPQLNMPGLTLEILREGNRVSKFDLSLIASVANDKLTFSFEYSTLLFKQETVERFIACFKQVINAVLSNVDIKILDIDILAEGEKHRLINEFNATRIDYPCGDTISALFEEQVSKAPEHTAVICGNEAMSFAQLKDTSDKIAFHLCREHGIQPGDRIGLLLERDRYLVPAILGILKAGAAYMPIDPAYPPERIKYLLADSQVDHILTHPSLQQLCRQLDTSARYVDVTCMDLPLENSDQSLPAFSSAELAYLIYTSGSTGNPKGVMIEHRNVVNFVRGVSDKIGFEAGDTILGLTTVSFDIFVLETILPLLKGLRIVLAGADDQKNPYALRQLITQQAVNCLQITPSHLKLLLANDGQRDALKDVRILMVGGEAFPLELLMDLRKRYKGKIFNMYGPTETTVWSVIQDLTIAESINIGKPIANTSIRILDRHKKLLPLGVEGELYIGGEGVARGYWKREELNREKFIADPIHTDSVIYRTGDIAKWLPDGNIAFLGRLDDQVKIRGHRIELGEIEHHLISHEAIQEAVIIAKEKEGEKYLVAYYIPESAVKIAVLRSYLSGKLPEYMIPAYFVPLERLPLTPNGKLNKRALPDPVIRIGEDYVAPASETEKKLVAIWAELLKTSKELISINKNFFELGGHSIRAVHLINRIWEEFSIRIELRKIFEHTTVESLARLIDHSSDKYGAPIPIAEKREYYIASPAQERLFYQQLLNKNNLAHNICGAFEINGEIDIDKIEQSFQALIDRHEGLRTGFVLSAENVVHRIEPYTAFSLTEVDGNKYTFIEEAFRDFVRPFDLTRSPLMRCGLMNWQGNNILFVDIHHAVCDGISLNILMNDFRNIYCGNELQPLGVRYTDYASWQRSRSHTWLKQKKYWAEKLSGELPVLDLPVYQDRSEVEIHTAALEVLEISSADYKDLKAFTAAANVSEFMFLLSVYYILLHKVSGNKDIIIGTDAAGRVRPELKQVVGSFVNLLPLRLHIDPASSYAIFLQEVKTGVLDAFDNQEFQFDQMVALLDRKEEMESRPIVQVHFAFANFLEEGSGLDQAGFTPLHIRGHQTTQYEFKLEVTEKDNKLQVAFVYSDALYDASFISVLAEYYHNILRAVLRNASIDITGITLTGSLSFA